jgi:hypothetical protein
MAQPLLTIMQELHFYPFHILYLIACWQMKQSLSKITHWTSVILMWSDENPDTIQHLRHNSKAIPVTDCRGLWVCEMLRIPHCIDTRLTNGGEVVSLMHPLPPPPPETIFPFSGTYFCYRPSKPQGLVQLEGLGNVKKYITSVLY